MFTITLIRSSMEKLLTLFKNSYCRQSLFLNMEIVKCIKETNNIAKDDGNDDTIINDD